MPKGAHDTLAPAAAESDSKFISISKTKLMDRAIELPIHRLFSKRASGKSLLVLTRIKTGQGTLRIYRFGNLVLHEMFTRLPDLFLLKECKTIKSEKKIRVVCVPLRIGQAIKSVYIKQHNAVSLKHRLASIFSTSAALRSLYGAPPCCKKVIRPLDPLPRWSTAIGAS